MNEGDQKIHNKPAIVEGEKPFEFKRPDLESKVAEVEARDRRFKDMKISSFFDGGDFEGQRPWQMNVKVTDAGALTDGLQKMFPDRNFTLTKTRYYYDDKPSHRYHKVIVGDDFESLDPANRGKSVTTENIIDWGAVVDGYRYFIKEYHSTGFPSQGNTYSIMTEPVNREAPMKDVHHLEFDIVPDVIDYVEDTEKMGAELAQSYSESDRRFHIMVACKKILLEVGRVRTGGPGTYDLLDEDSGYLPDTFAMILTYGLDKQSAERFMEIIQGEDPRAKILEAQPLRGISILDIGCGREANFLRFLKELGADVKGLDMQKPKKEAEGTVFQGDINKLETISPEIRNAKFDFVITTMTFVPEAAGERGLLTALKMIAPGGLFICSPHLNNEHFPAFREKDDPGLSVYFNFANQRAYDYPLLPIIAPTVPTVIYKKKEAA